MRVEVVYIFPVCHAASYSTYCERFVASYLANQAGFDHETTIVCNGGMADNEAKGLFSILPRVKFLYHDNSGYDIGGFQAAARASGADMIVFFGTSAYLRTSGWLGRMATALHRLGPGQYGCMANRGHEAVGVYPHLRTTGFWTIPGLFNACPFKVTEASQRHPFEHGPNCFSEWIRKQGLKNWLVTDIGQYLWPEWDSAPGGYHRDNQINLLTGDRLTEPPYYHCA